MASGIEIHEDLVAGLVPVLKNPDALEQGHTLAKGVNPLLHLTHAALMASLKTRTGYDELIIDAVDVGARAYEALGANMLREPVPIHFALRVIADREKNPNFSLNLGDMFHTQRERFISEATTLAEGVYEISLPYVKDSGLVNTYSLGGAAVMRTAHEEIRDMWEWEKSLGVFSDIS